jgi:hypothetical protein
MARRTRMWRARTAGAAVALGRTPAGDVIHAGVAAAAAVLSLAPAVVLLRMLGDAILVDRTAQALVAGVLAAVAASRWTLRWTFLNTFAHELGHLLPALVTGGTIAEFRASAAHGGHVRHASNWRTIVTLGPYVLPLAAFAVAGLSLLQGGSPRPGWALFTGMAVGYHGTVVWADVRLCRAHGVTGTDLGVCGLPTSLAWILAVNAVVLSTLTVYAAFGPAAVIGLWRASAGLVQQTGGEGLRALEAAVRGLAPAS